MNLDDMNIEIGLSFELCDANSITQTILGQFLRQYSSSNGRDLVTLCCQICMLWLTTCAETHFEEKLTQRKSEPAKLLFLEIRGTPIFSYEELLDIDQEVMVDGERYTKAFTSVLIKGDPNHFVQIFNWGNEVMIYDGMGGPEGVYKKFSKGTLPRTSRVVNVTYVHRPSFKI